MEREIIPLQGLHCRSCEIVTEQNISAVPGVKKVKINRSGTHATAQIWWEGKRPDPAALVAAVEEAGYRVGEDETKHIISRDGRVWFESFLAAAAVFLVYVVAKIAGFSGFDAGITQSPTLATIFLIGLTAGVSTCMAVVGGLVMGISASHAASHPERKGFAALRPHIFFNAGRLAGYAILGGIIGAAGGAIQISQRVAGILVLFAGIVMIFLALQIFELFPRFSAFSLPKAISKMFGISRRSGTYSSSRSFLAGAGTFFLPCGFTQAMQLYAISSGSFSTGAATMFVFALGTMPGLLGVGGIVSFAKGAIGRLLFRAIAVVVLVFGIINIAAGLSASGISVPWSRLEGETGTTAPIEEGYQTVRMEQRSDGYYPNIFTVQAGVPVKWIITSTSQYSCATTVSLPALNIVQRLVPGENIVEFTPTTPGRLIFSCGMGMYTGQFTVTK